MRRLALLAALALPAAATGAGPELSIRDAWLRAPAPGATALAAYATVVNAGAGARRCAAASGPDFGAAELHRTVIEDGMSRMRRGEAIELPPGGSATLAPGGLHIMLFRPARALGPGDRTRIRLSCGAEAVEADFIVRGAP